MSLPAPHGQRARSSRGLRRELDAQAAVRMLWCPDNASPLPARTSSSCLVAARAGARPAQVLVSTRSHAGSGQPSAPSPCRTGAKRDW